MGDESLNIFFKEHINHHFNIDVISYGTRSLRDWDDAVLIRPYWRIKWGNKAGARFKYLNQDLSLKPECFIIIPPHLEVEHEFIEDFTVFHLNVDLGKFFQPYPEIFELPLGDESKQILHQIIAEPNLDDFRRQAQLDSLIMKMIQSLDPSLLGMGIKHRKIVEVIQYMEDHLSDYLSNDILAHHCGLSTNSFIRLFSKETSMSPQEYLRNIRLDASASLLLKTKLGVTEICKMCGFSERNYFSRVFSKRFKMGPVSFRKSELNLYNRPDIR